MSRNSYEDFKEGIKNDVNNYVFTFFHVIAFFILLVLAITVPIVIFGKYSHSGIFTKAITVIVLLFLAYGMIFNRRLGNVIINVWTAIVLIAVVGLVLAIGGYLIYLMLYAMIKDNF